MRGWVSVSVCVRYSVAVVGLLQSSNAACAARAFEWLWDALADDATVDVDPSHLAAGMQVYGAPRSTLSTLSTR